MKYIFISVAKVFKRITALGRNGADRRIYQSKIHGIKITETAKAVSVCFYTALAVFFGVIFDIWRCAMTSP